jgi:hypothetical protein
VNHSIYSADRMTHLKIAVTALIAGIVVVSVGIAIRLVPDDGTARTTRVIKAGKMVTIVRSSANLVRWSSRTFAAGNVPSE